jgi:hypothetical protein
MSYEEASRRELDAFESLQKAVAQRSQLDATVAIYSDHRERYDAAVEHLLAAVQAYEAASQDLIAARAARNS